MLSIILKGIGFSIFEAYYYIIRKHSYGTENSSFFIEILV
jgi:hypothetical protein